MQPTEKLYEADAFTRRFTAAVLACEPVPGGWRAALDRTAFYPEGGGQPCDTGTLGGAIGTNHKVQNLRPHFDFEHFGSEGDFPGFLLVLIVNFHNSHCFISCVAHYCLRTSTRPFFGPGTAPLIRMTLSSGRTSTIFRPCWVTRSAPH